MNPAHRPDAELRRVPQAEASAPRLPHDPALPQLAHALDADRMASVFAAALGAVPLRTCRVDRVKYRPGRNCSVSYVLTLHDAQRGGDVEQRVAARFCSGGTSAERHLDARRHAQVASAAGPALMHDPALDMLAHWWPNDPKLEAVALLHDDAHLRTHCIEKAAAALTGATGCLLGHRTSIAQYVPEVRVCARVDVTLRRSGTAPASHATLFAKADTQHAGSAVHAAMQALWHSSAQAAGRFATPQPLLWQAAAGLHWQRGVAGRPLHEVDPATGSASSARVAERLAALHATPVAGLPRVTSSALARRVDGVAALLGQVEPSWQGLLGPLAARIAAGASRWGDAPPATLHGDLHPANIVDGGATLTFIDLDSMCAGPAVVELGAWVGDAMVRAVHAGTSQAQATPAWRAFLGAYAAASGRPVDERALAWSVAHHLLCTRAYRGVANLKAGRFEAVPAVLALAARVAEAGSVDAALEWKQEAA